MPNCAAAFLSSHTADGMVQFCCPQSHTVNWPTMSQPPDLYLRNNQETIYEPLLNGVGQIGNRTVKVSADNSGFSLSLLSRYSSDICVESAMQPTTMSSSTGQGQGQGSCTSLHLNNSIVQFSCSHGLEDMETSASLSSRTHNITLQSGHDEFRDPRSSRIFPFGWE
ncbi:uncharacterized protein [Spinacia oleracea]|uniref:Uncharacterized protein isoform X1 n=1 Tax=Spinacia oleracea TaxID=3562 RepID=A0A9R0K049_SPIOL|nr:uncharacterized protein LOC110792413 isoform X1 [Spinacia oleracea]